MPQNDKALLQRLLQHKVEFVVIGGVCGILYGTALVTYDLDICCRFNRENLRRIETAVRWTCTHVTDWWPINCRWN